MCGCWSSGDGNQGNGNLRIKANNKDAGVYEMSMVSVIIPCYNLEEYIVECIKSVEKQSFDDFEIIIVDDGSKDNSVNNIKKYISDAEITNIELVCKKNGGASSARNEGIKYAKGKYISFIDGDDFIDTDYLKNRVEAAIQNDADLCVGGIRTYQNETYGETCILNRNFFEGSEEIEKNIDELKFMFIDPIGKLYRRKIIQDFNLQFDERLKVTEDFAFALDFFSHVNRLQIIDDCTYNYRIRSDSLIHQVTLPTKQKYVWNHAVDFFEDLDTEFILKKNPVFCSYIWDFGLLNRIQSNILCKEDFKKILATDLAKDVVGTFEPVSKKDKLFLYCIKKKYYFLIYILVRLKYWTLKNFNPIYTKVKKTMG